MDVEFAEEFVFGFLRTLPKETSDIKRAVHDESSAIVVHVSGNGGSSDVVVDQSVLRHLETAADIRWYVASKCGMDPEDCLLSSRQSGGQGPPALCLSETLSVHLPREMFLCVARFGSLEHDERSMAQRDRRHNQKASRTSEVIDALNPKGVSTLKEIVDEGKRSTRAIVRAARFRLFEICCLLFVSLGCIHGYTLWYNSHLNGSRLYPPVSIVGSTLTNATLANAGYVVPGTSSYYLLSSTSVTASGFNCYKLFFDYYFYSPYRSIQYFISTTSGFLGYKVAATSAPASSGAYLSTSLVYAPSLNAVIANSTFQSINCSAGMLPRAVSSSTADMLTAVDFSQWDSSALSSAVVAVVTLAFFFVAVVSLSVRFGRYYALTKGALAREWRCPEYLKPALLGDGWSTGLFIPGFALTLSSVVITLSQVLKHGSGAGPQSLSDFTEVHKYHYIADVALTLGLFALDIAWMVSIRYVVCAGILLVVQTEAKEVDVAKANRATRGGSARPKTQTAVRPPHIVAVMNRSISNIVDGHLKLVFAGYLLFTLVTCLLSFNLLPPASSPWKPSMLSSSFNAAAVALSASQSGGMWSWQHGTPIVDGYAAILVLFMCLFCSVAVPRALSGSIASCVCRAHHLRCHARQHQLWWDFILDKCASAHNMDPTTCSHTIDPTDSAMETIQWYYKVNGGAPVPVKSLEDS